VLLLDEKNSGTLMPRIPGSPAETLPERAEIARRSPLDNKSNVRKVNPLYDDYQQEF
jgi:hypothetical protein